MPPKSLHLEPKVPKSGPKGLQQTPHILPWAAYLGWKTSPFLALRQKSYVSGEILRFRRNPTLQEKSYASGEILLFLRPEKAPAGMSLLRNAIFEVRKSQTCYFWGPKKPLRACHCSEMLFLRPEKAPAGMLRLRIAIFFNELRILNLEFRIMNYEFEIQNSEFWIQSSWFWIQSSEFWILNMVLNSDFRTLNYECTKGQNPHIFQWCTSAFAFSREIVVVERCKWPRLFRKIQMAPSPLERYKWPRLFRKIQMAPSLLERYKWPHLL